MLKKLGYWRRIAGKTICFFFFGLGAFVIEAVIYPPLSLFVRDEAKLRKATRGIIRGSFRLFVDFMRFMRVIEVEFENADLLRDSSGLIVAANHPSLIDVVILGSVIRQSDCIVKRALWDTPFVRWIVRRSYIPNSLGFDETAMLCASSLEEGNTLIVFPEGTRTKEGQAPDLKRGAARIALSTGCDILPVRISSSDTRGLRKGDPFFSMPEDGPIKYSVKALGPISVDEYRGIEPALGARALTKRLSEVISNYPLSEPIHG
jgi:1-acyl-sn-glycerol-3-phosphate acyltransferase